MGKKILVFVCIAVMLAALSGCGKQAEESARPQLVKTQQVSYGSSAQSGTYAGSVRGRYETNMSFQVGGQILNRNVQVGQRVRAGDVLMIIDAKDVVQKSNQGDAQVDSAKAQLTLAQANLARYKELYAEDAVPAATLDQYQTSYDAAAAAYQQALAQAMQGHNALSYTNLAAGADGVISAINAEAGQVVAAGQTVLTLVQSGEMEVEINVPENHIQDVPVGKEVRVTLWALNNTAVDGVVREAAPMADPTARTYKVRVSVPNPPEGMALGMTASVQCSGAGAETAGNTVILPLSAIYQTGNEPEVWLVGEDHKLVLQSVKVENFGDNQVRVTGLTDGDIVVTAGVHKLREGQEVRLGDDA